MPRRSTINIVVTPEEKATFEAAAVMCGVSISKFMRLAAELEVERVTKAFKPKGDN